MTPNNNEQDKNAVDRFDGVLQTPEAIRILTPLILVPPLLRARNTTHFHNQEVIYEEGFGNVSQDIQNHDICKELSLLNIEDADKAVTPKISYVRTKQLDTLIRPPITTSFPPKYALDHFTIDHLSYSSSYNTTKLFRHSPKGDEQCQSSPFISKLLLRPRLTFKKRRLSLQNQEGAHEEGSTLLSPDKQQQKYRIPFLNQSDLSDKEDDDDDDDDDEDEGDKLNFRKKLIRRKLPVCVLLPSLDDDNTVNHWSKDKFSDNGISRCSFPILNLSLKARSKSKRKYCYV